MRTLRRLLALLSCALASSAQAATEIVWWHAMVDANRAAVEQLADEFNRSQRDYVVKPQYKGVYSETLAAGLAAFEDGDAPHILQVVEVGTATMMAATGAVKPIHEVMRDARQYFEPRSYLPAIVGYYSTASGEMLSFPFNSSSAVMWVNKDALTRAGLGGAKLTTWPEVFDAAARLRANGHESCGFSSAWITWIMIEQFSAWHDLPVATRSNGLEGLDAELRIHSPLHARHLATLAELQRSKTFDYSGRNEEGEARFLSGECAILTSSSGFYGRIRANVRFAFDALPLPYYPEAEGAPQNTLIGGASLWAMSGKTPHEYKGVARFFAFLSETERQAMLHQRLGYLPVTRAAYDATRASGFYRTTPLLETALLSLTRKPVTPNSRGLRLGDMTALRDAWAEEIEAALRGEKTADAALAAAQARGDAILRRFEARAQ